MDLIDGLNINALRKDLVEYWASVYSGESVTKTNVYIPAGSSCAVSESVSLMSLSDNGYVATLDKNGEFETTSENVSVIGRTDDVGEEKIAEPIATLDDTANKLLADADALTVTFDVGDSADSVKSNLILSDVGGYGSEISWKSSNTNVITDDGKVIRGAIDQTVTMTAALTLNNQNISKSFDVVVKANTIYITVDDCVIEDDSVEVNAYAVNELSTDKDGVMIIALYNKNQLVENHIQDVSTTPQISANVNYVFSDCNFTETDTPMVKVFWLNDLEKLMPICDSVLKEVK